jgi:uncharacterized membrane protein
MKEYGKFSVWPDCPVVISILIYFGVAHRVLDRQRLSDKGALAVIALIIVGSFFDIPLSTRVTINQGGYCGCWPASICLAGSSGTVRGKDRSRLPQP